MNRYVLRLPDELYGKVRDQASREGVSINQFLLYSITKAVIAHEAHAFIAERAKGHDLAKALALLDRVADVPPEHPGDAMPKASSRERRPRAGRRAVGQSARDWRRPCGRVLKRH